MKTLLCAVLVAASSQAFADCKTSLPLQGVISIKGCDQRTGTCIAGTKAVYDYLKEVNDDETVLTIALNASPWRLYDKDGRILSIEELVDLARPQIAKGAKHIVLIASWTGVAPNPGGKSLAQKLSDSLKGFPVRGMDGFLWIAKDGALRTTRQALTVRQGGNPYSIVEGDEVMVSLAAGWPAEEEAIFIKERNADGILRAGVGWDLFFLCPDRALQAFDAAAKMSHPIAAYNAALMRLERGDKGDHEAAIALLAQAVAAGDKKAQAKLDKLKKESR